MVSVTLYVGADSDFFQLTVIGFDVAVLWPAFTVTVTGCSSFVPSAFVISNLNVNVVSWSATTNCPSLFTICFVICILLFSYSSSTSLFLAITSITVVSWLNVPSPFSISNNTYFPFIIVSVTLYVGTDSDFFQLTVIGSDVAVLWPAFTSTVTGCSSFVPSAFVISNLNVNVVSLSATTKFPFSSTICFVTCISFFTVSSLLLAITLIVSFFIKVPVTVFPLVVPFVLSILTKS